MSGDEHARLTRKLEDVAGRIARLRVGLQSRDKRQQIKSLYKEARRIRDHLDELLRASSRDRSRTGPSTPAPPRDRLR